jgi:Flp pilus assembly protein TadG
MFNSIQRRGGQRGVAAVEFALLLTILAPLTFGGTELGRMFYEYNTLLKSSRQAARAMSLVAGAAGEDSARCLAVTGQPTCADGDASLLDGLSTANVFFVYGTVSNGVANVPVVRVEIRNYAFVSLLSWLVPNVTFGPLGTTVRQVAS